MVQARRRGRAAARLHVRIVALFSVIAAVPAILVAVVASVTLDRGLDRLFSQQTHSLIENSLIVADAYVREHVQIRARRHHRDRHRARARQAAVRSDRASSSTSSSSVQASIRGLPAVMLLDKDAQRHRPGRRRQVNQTFVKPSRRGARRRQRHRAAGRRCSSTPTTSPPSSSCAATTTPISTSRACSIRACSRNCARRRPASPNIADLEARRIGIQIAFALMYTVIALIVLLSAVWIGLNFANYLVAPIRRLIGAAQIVVDRQPLRAGADPARRKAISPSSARPSTR